MSEDYTLGTYSQLDEIAGKKQQPTSATPVEPARPQKVNEQAKQARKQLSNQDSKIARYHDSKPDSDEDVLEVIRKAVKPIGKEASFHRLTTDEKDVVEDIVYAQKKKGITTSENEITRIALNYLVWEYQHNKQESILARVLERLNA